MNKLRHIEIFSAGCPVCEDTVTLVKTTCLSLVQSYCSRHARPFHFQPRKNIGIRTVPAVVVDGQSAECCAGGGPSDRGLLAAGIGTPLR